MLRNLRCAIQFSVKFEAVYNMHVACRYFENSEKTTEKGWKEQGEKNCCCVNITLRFLYSYRPVFHVMLVFIVFVLHLWIEHVSYVAVSLTCCVFFRLRSSPTINSAESELMMLKVYEKWLPVEQVSFKCTCIFWVQFSRRLIMFVP